jgi:hypothetical protein
MAANVMAFVCHSRYTIAAAYTTITARIKIRPSRRTPGTRGGASSMIRPSDVVRSSVVEAMDAVSAATGVSL